MRISDWSSDVCSSDLFDTVVVQQDICNGCGYCVPACPFGVVAVDELDGKAHKCTLCYDRPKGGMEPACSKVCPTESIQFGERSEEHTSELQSLMRISYAVFCLKKKTNYLEQMY